MVEGFKNGKKTTSNSCYLFFFDRIFQPPKPFLLSNAQLFRSEERTLQEDGMGDQSEFVELCSKAGRKAWEQGQYREARLCFIDFFLKEKERKKGASDSVF